jgi:uncharacterized membrane protein
MSMTRNQRIRFLTIHSMFIALIAIMGFIPFLGFLPIGAGVSITLVHLPVLLGAALLSTRSATLFGLTFGVVSLLVVLTNPAPLPTDLFFANPMVSVFPRILFGFIAGLLFSITRKFSKLNGFILLTIFAFIATVIHTVLVLTMLWIFEGAALVDIFGNLLNFIWVILGVNGFVEAIVAAAIIPTLTFTLRRIRFVSQFQQR